MRVVAPPVLLFVLSVAVPTLVGCSGPETAEAEHPHWEIEPGFRSLSGESTSRTLLELSSALAAADVEWEIGALEGPAETVFGNPVDVAVQEGNVFVLDAMENEVRIFTESGEFVERFGRKGRGPLEFQFPRAMQFTENGTLMVAMPSGLKFIAVDDSGPSLVRTRRVDRHMPPPSDACVLGSTTYAKSHNMVATDDLVFVIDSAGSDRGSFDKGYPYGSWLVRSELSDGFIECLQEPPTVVTAFKFLPLIRGYSPEGRLRWTAYVPKFQALRWLSTETKAGEMVRIDRTQPGDRVLSLTSIPHGAVLVQVAHLGAAAKEIGGQRIQRIDSYVLSATTGDGVFVGSKLPRILHAETQRLWAVRASRVGYLKVLQLRYSR